MDDLWVVVLRPNDLDRITYGPIEGESAAYDFAEFLTDEVDPAVAYPLRSPVKELLSWRSATTSPREKT